MSFPKVQLKSKGLSFKEEEEYNIYPKTHFTKGLLCTSVNIKLETLEEGQGLG